MRDFEYGRSRRHLTSRPGQSIRGAQDRARRAYCNERATPESNIQDRITLGQRVAPFPRELSVRTEAQQHAKTNSQFHAGFATYYLRVWSLTR